MLVSHAAFAVFVKGPFFAVPTAIEIRARNSLGRVTIGGAQVRVGSRLSRSLGALLSIAAFEKGDDLLQHVDAELAFERDGLRVGIVSLFHFLGFVVIIVVWHKFDQANISVAAVRSMNG